MCLLADPLPPLDIRSLGTIEDEQGKERGVHEAGTTEEESTEFGVLAFPAVGGVEEPVGGVDTDAKAAERDGGGGGWGSVETVLESNVGKGTGLCCWTEDLWQVK
jgi:hypothetical protein